MADFSEQIAQIEDEIRKTPFHKGTEHHIGRLRARLARLRDKEYEALTKKGGGGGTSFAVKKTGDATVVLVGPPSVGKSTLINKLTNTQSKVAEYAFTTVSVIPGMMKYNDAYIQIFDIPGLIIGASLGKGRGKEVLSVARVSDLLVIMTDIERVDLIEKICSELEGAGIRINKVRPDVQIKKSLGGGIILHSNIKQDISDQTIKEIIGEFGIKNGDINIKQKITIDELIDSVSTSRVYLPAIFVVNKIDTDSNYKSRLRNDFIPISADKRIGLDYLIEGIWKSLGLVKIYLVKGDEKPNTQNPIIVKRNDNLGEVAMKIGEEFAEGKKAAKIWGEKASFPGQEVSLTTKVSEGMQIRFI